MCQIAGCFPVEYFIFFPFILPLHDHLSISPSQSRITCSPIAVLSTRVQWWVHFLPLQGEFVGPKKQQGFSWLHTVFTIIYSYLSLTTLMGWIWLRKHTWCKAMKYYTLRLRQLHVEHYTAWGKSFVVQNCVSLWQHTGGGCRLLNLKFPLCLRDSE